MTDGSHVRSFELFRTFTDEELETFLRLCRVRNIAPGEVICSQGEVGDSCFVLVKGTVIVYKDVPGRGRLSFAPLTPGAIFGQVSLLDGFPRLATWEARGPVRVLELSGERFQQLLKSRTRLAVTFQLELARSLVRQLRTANHRLGEIEDLPEGGRESDLLELLERITGAW